MNNTVYDRLRSVYNELIEISELPGVSLESINDISDALTSLGNISSRMNLGGRLPVSPQDAAYERTIAALSKPENMAVLKRLADR